jgi:TolA-binding protein
MMENSMHKTKKHFQLFGFISMLGLGLALNGCSMMPWSGNDKEEDLAFESDAPVDQKKSEDDFFADDKGKGKDKDSGFASTDQETDSKEMKSGVHALQEKQDALTKKVRELEETLLVLQPKVDATQQKLEGGLGAISQKSDYLEPEVKELKAQIAKLNEDLSQLKGGKAKATGKAVKGKGKGGIPPEYTKAHQAYMKGNFEESIVMFQNLAVKNPSEDLQDNIAYWIGVNYSKLGKFDEAIKQFQEVLAKYPKGNKTHDSRYMLGYCYFKKGDKARATDTLEAAMKANPPKDVRDKIEKQLKEIQ